MYKICIPFQSAIKENGKNVPFVVLRMYKLGLIGQNLVQVSTLVQVVSVQCSKTDQLKVGK